jgi:hypothetical protein
MVLVYGDIQYTYIYMSTIFEGSRMTKWTLVVACHLMNIVGAKVVYREKSSED